MKLNDIVTWMESGNEKDRPIKNGQGRPRILSGLIIDIEDSLGDREFLIHIIEISGPSPEKIYDRIWKKRSEILQGRCRASDHFNPSTPFDRLMERHEAMKLKHKRDRKEMHKIVANVAAMGAKLPRGRRNQRPH